MDTMTPLVLSEAEEKAARLNAARVALRLADGDLSKLADEYIGVPVREMRPGESASFGGYTVAMCDPPPSFSVTGTTMPSQGIAGLGIGHPLSHYNASASPRAGLLGGILGGLFWR